MIALAFLLGLLVGGTLAAVAVCACVWGHGEPPDLGAVER